jgi:hypothetical protein
MHGDVEKGTWFGGNLRNQNLPLRKRHAARLGAKTMS